MSVCVSRWRTSTGLSNSCVWGSMFTVFLPSSTSEGQWWQWDWEHWLVHWLCLNPAVVANAWYKMNLSPLPQRNTKKEEWLQLSSCRQEVSLQKSWRSQMIDLLWRIVRGDSKSIYWSEKFVGGSARTCG